MADDKILIPVDADVDKLESQIKSAVKDINSQLKNISFTSLVSGINAAINLADRLGSSLVSAFSAPIAEAAAADQAIEKLNISLKLSGSFSKEASDQFLALASSLQETTTFSDEAAAGALSLAKNLGLTNDQALKVTKAAADLAAITGGSLDEATQALSKSLQGNGNQLQRQLPFLKGLTEQQLRAGAAVDIVAQKFAGAAAALGQTFSGSITRTNNLFSDLLETVGRFITQNPIIIGLINQLGKVFNELNSFILANKDTIRAFIDTALIGMIDAFVTIGKAVSTVIQIIAPLASQIATFVGVAIGLKVIPAILTSIAAAFEGVSIASTAARVSVNAFKIAATLGLSLIVDQLIKIASASSSVDDFFQKLSASIKNALLTVLDSLLFVFNKFIDLGSKIPGIGDQFKSIQDSVKGFRQELKLSQEQGEKGSNRLNDGIKSVGETIGSLTAKLSKFGDEAKKNFGKTAKAASSLISNNITFKPQLDAAAFKNAVEQGKKDILGGLGIKLNVQQLDISAEGATLLGAGSQVISSLFKGAQGATQLFSTVAGQIADVIIPGLGGVAAEIFNVLAAGPQAVSGFVSGFINSIPIIIENIILSLPALIEALVNGLLELPQKISDALSNSLPEVIGKLAAQAPFIATKFALALQVQAPFIARSFAFSFVKEGIPAIVKGFIEEIKNQIKSLGGLFGGGGGGIGGAVSGIVGKVGKIFGFANGGMPVFSGGDNILAGFNAKELVVDRTDTERLSRFLDAQEERNRAINTRTSVTNVTVPVQLDRSVLAQAIFQLNQDGFRVS
jgi:hypothetical protein